MSKRKDEDQRIVDLGHDIIKDSKRRLLYYNEKTKKGYQVYDKDLKWVRFYKMRLFVSIFTYFVLFLYFRNSAVYDRFFISLIASVIVYFATQLLFEKLFFKDKVPFKINQKDFDQRYELDVLKHKRLLEYFHFAFVLIYGVLAFIELYFADSPLWIKLATVIITLALAVWLLSKILALNSQIKIEKQNDGQ